MSASVLQAPVLTRLYVNGDTTDYQRQRFLATGSLTGTTAVFSGHLTTDQVIIKHDYSYWSISTKANDTMLGLICLMRERC